MTLIWFIQNNVVSLLYKELIMPYKSICGIYKITNTVNNKYYIGSAISIRYRLNTHKRLLRDNKHFNKHLQASYNKYGLSNFVFEQLEVTTKEVMIEREQFWIDQLDASNPKKGYNKRINASSNLGIKASEETRKKLSVAHMGHKRSKEAQLKISASQYKKVVQINFDGSIVKEYLSLQDAAKETGVQSTGISMCLNGTIKSTGGYCWCKKENLDTFIIPNINHKFIPNKVKEQWKIN
jgi:hypothetical protein